MWRKDVLATTPYSVNRIPCDLVPLGYWWLESLGAHLHGCFLQKECAVGVRLQNLCWRYQTSGTLNESFSHVFSSNVTTNGGTCVPWLTSLLPWPKAYRRSTSIRSTILNSELVSCSSRWRPHWAKCLCSISPSLSWASSQESFCLQMHETLYDPDKDRNGVNSGLSGLPRPRCWQRGRILVHAEAQSKH